MAEKDITERNLESYNDVFADIVNVLLFQGQRLIQDDELEAAEPRSSYKADGKIHELERDVSKFWRRQAIRIACIGLENQTKADPYMPLRVMGYDGAAYRAQLLDTDDNGTPKAVYPVVTLVLYFGSARWRKPLTLYGCLDIPQALKPYINDHKINLFQIAYLSEEQVQLFKSDFRIVADYFVQSRKNKDYIPTDRTVKHIHEVLQMLEALTGDTRFTEARRTLKGGETTMSEAILDRLEQKLARQIEDRLSKEITESVTKKVTESVTKEVTESVTKEVTESVTKEVTESVTKEVTRSVTDKVEEQTLAMIHFLMTQNRSDDIQRVMEDPTYRRELFSELRPQLS